MHLLSFVATMSNSTKMMITLVRFSIFCTFSYAFRDSHPFFISIHSNGIRILSSELSSAQEGFHFVATRGSNGKSNKNWFHPIQINILMSNCHAQNSIIAIKQYTYSFHMASTGSGCVNNSADGGDGGGGMVKLLLSNYILIYLTRHELRKWGPIFLFFSSHFNFIVVVISFVRNSL